MKDKYKVAVIKRPVEFSKETYNKAYNDFSQFVAQNTTMDKIVANAEESGYRLLERADFRSAEHRVGGVKGTREALKWIFAAKEGEVSPLYECGENDHLMVVALEKINPAGYRNINLVADMLKAEIRTSQEPGYNEIDRVLHSDSTVIEYLPGRWADRRAFEIQRQKAYKTLNRNVFPSMRSAKAQITTTESVPDGEIALPTADYDPSGISVPAVDIPDAKPGDSREWTRGLYLKTNAVGWAMLISNIAVEVDINKYWSVTLPVYYSALNYFTRTRKLRTLAFQPEVRWWFAPKWFVGAHFGVAQYNYALSSSEWRYQDHNGNTPALGGGLSFGWRTPLGKSKHWMMELTAGAGCYRLKYDTFHNEVNGAMVSTTSRTFFGVDNAAVTFIYRFDLKRKRR